MKSPKKLYKYHVVNLQEIDFAMGRVALSIREAISMDDGKTASSLTCLYILLLGAWAEVRLKKLTYEPKGFPDEKRKKILASPTQLGQWCKALELGFREQYSVPKAKLSTNTLSHSNYSRYKTLSDMLTDDLGPIITLRNKLAHGQWIYPLNSNGDDIAQDQMDALRVENLLSLQFKKSLLKSLAAIIHDLVVSRPTFERDFDNHFRVIFETKRNLQKRDYGKYVINMRQKYLRGQQKK